MRSIFGNYFIAPARITNAGRVNAAVIECTPDKAEFYDLFFTGTDGVTEHVESFEQIESATEAAGNLNRRYYATV